MDRMIRDKTGKFIKHANPNSCSICGKSPIEGHGFCNRHYLRFIRYGNPNIRKKNANGEGGLSRGYKMVTIEGKRVFEHRHIVSMRIGRALTKREIVHHLDGNKLNNSPDNLVLLSRSDHVKNHPESIANLKLGPLRRGTIR